MRTFAAATCPMLFRFGDQLYSPWCAPVRGDLLGASEISTDPSAGSFSKARAIDGVPVEAALAISLWRTSPERPLSPKGSEARRRCGLWSFAPAGGLELREARRIARSVTVPGSFS